MVNGETKLGGGVYGDNGRVLARGWRLAAVALGLLVLLAVVLGFSGSALADPLGETSDFATPTVVSHPFGIAAGPDGNLWFTENGANKIGEINPVTDAISEFPIPTASSGLNGISVGPDGNLWFTEQALGRIGEINPVTDAISEFPTPTAGSAPWGIAAGADGNLWFTESFASQIGEINPVTHAISEFPTPTANSGPEEIAAGPDGNLWFTENRASQIGEINPVTHAISEFPTPTANSGPEGIAAGPDGNLWFTEYAANMIGEINPVTHAISEFPTPTVSSRPLEIAAGPDGNLWFTEVGASQIGEINPATDAISEFPTPTGSSGPHRIAVGSDGNLWFTEAGANKIGMIGAGAPAASIAPPTVTGSAYLGNQVSCQGATWSAWAGQQPSLSEYGFDGYQWLRNGSPIAGATSQSYTVAVADADQQVSCTVTVTYPLLQTTTSATSAAVTVFTLCGGATHSAADITEYPAQVSPFHNGLGGGPEEIAAGADGDLWFTDGGSAVYQFSPSRSCVNQFTVSNEGVSTNDITAGPDGALWFTQGAGGNPGGGAPYFDADIGRITTSGVLTDFTVPSSAVATPGLDGITVGSDRNLWFTEVGENQIGRITTSGAVTEFRLPAGNVLGDQGGGNAETAADSIAAGPGGDVWFTEPGSHAIGVISTAGQFLHKYPVSGVPLGIADGPGGAMWFTDAVTPWKIGRITPAGTVTEFSAPSAPWSIVEGPDHNMWFTESNGADTGLGCITATGQIALHPEPTPGGNPDGVAVQDGSIWFAELNADQLGRLSPVACGATTSHTTRARLDDQQITLTTASLLACTARAKKLGVSLDSTTIAHSRAAKLRFSSAAFYLDKGVKHTHRKTITTRNGKKKTVTVTSYSANATAHHVPVTVELSIAGLKPGMHTLKVKLSYKKTKKRHGHKITVTVTKTLRTKFKVC